MMYHQAAVANLIGVSPSTVANYETNGRLPHSERQGRRKVWPEEIVKTAFPQRITARLREAKMSFGPLLRNPKSKAARRQVAGRLEAIGDLQGAGDLRSGTLYPVALALTTERMLCRVLYDMDTCGVPLSREEVYLCILRAAFRGHSWCGSVRECFFALAVRRQGLVIIDTADGVVPELGPSPAAAWTSLAPWNPRSKRFKQRLQNWAARRTEPKPRADCDQPSRHWHDLLGS